MRRCVPGAWIVAAIGCVAVPAAGQGASVVDLLEFRVPAPPAVGERKLDVGFEIAAPTGWPTVVKAKDGRMMMIGNRYIRYSKDGGRTWPRSDALSAPIDYAIRLKSGKLAGMGGRKFYISEDQGKTWKEMAEEPQGGAAGGPYPNTLFETRDGLLLLPARKGNSGHQGLYDSTGSWGTLGEKLVHTEGHAHFPEADAAFVCLSADEGEHWYRSNGTILIWHHDGVGGMWPCDEPSVVDARNGDIYMFIRTTLGRVYTSRSGPVSYFNGRGNSVALPRGVNFDHPKPTPLAGSYSPCAIAVVPKSGDWLIVWNQVSGDEIRAGYRRARLSSAISQDDGKTWRHFRTIDSVVVPPAGRVEPDPEPRMARGLDYVGVLPADYGSVHYACMSIVDDQVFLFYSRTVVRRRKTDVAGRRMRVLPLSWFYKDEPPLPSGPRLVVQSPSPDRRNWNSYDVPATYHQGRFFVNSKDLHTFLKSPMGRLGANIEGPLHQVITCLGWVPRYDRSSLDDPDDPRLIVRCNHVHAAPVTEYVAAHNPGNGDVWKYRNGSMFLGRLTSDPNAEQYSYDRIGRYDLAQSLKLDKPAKVIGIELYLDGGKDCKRPPTLSLCKDAGGKPSTELIAKGAAAVLPSAGGVRGFAYFPFEPPVSVPADVPIWMVLTKEDEVGENLMYSLPISSKDETGPRDWYGPGDVALRGPYKDAAKPKLWQLAPKRDAYFKIVAKLE